MPNMVGGVTFFMDTIMSYYKKNTTFVIARSYDKMLRLFINNEYQLENSYNLDESLLFIEKYQHKINKILFNHIFHMICGSLNNYYRLTNTRRISHMIIITYVIPLRRILMTSHQSIKRISTI